MSRHLTTGTYLALEHDRYVLRGLRAPGNAHALHIWHVPTRRAPAEMGWAS